MILLTPFSLCPKFASIDEVIFVRTDNSALQRSLSANLRFRPFSETAACTGLTAEFLGVEQHGYDLLMCQIR